MLPLPYGRADCETSFKKSDQQKSALRVKRNEQQNIYYLHWASDSLCVKCMVYVSDHAIYNKTESCEKNKKGSKREKQRKAGRKTDRVCWAGREASSSITGQSACILRKSCARSLFKRGINAGYITNPDLKQQWRWVSQSGGLVQAEMLLTSICSC